MKQANEAPAAIEGLELLVTGQKISPKPAMKIGGHIVWPLAIEKRGRSSIEKEHNPKKAKFREYSLLDQGSQIDGYRLWGFASDGPIVRDKIKVGQKGRTSSHSGQNMTITGNCLMELIRGIIGKPLLQHPRDFLLNQYKSSLSQFSIL